MEKLLLLDGNSMLFRAYYATLYTHRMSTSNGIPTNAIYGFIMMFIAWYGGRSYFENADVM